MLPDQGAVYGPEELTLLGRVLDETVRSLPASLRTRRNREQIARNILACAAKGARDPVELELAATVNLKVTVAA
jgi:hypothetical protein